MTVSVKDAVRDRWCDAHTRWEAEGRRRGGLVFWDRLVEPITKSLVEQGIDESWIQVGHHAMLPGAYGLGRSWDLTVVKDGVPLGAITLTSHNAPIKNFNNRVRELTSTAFDVRRQYASPELHDLRPCLGFFFILILADSQQADASASRPSGTHQKIGGGLPFQERYGKVFRQFRADGLYDSVAYCAVTAEGADASVAEPLPDMAIDSFLAHFAERVLSLAGVLETTGVTAASFGDMLSRSSDVNEILAGITSTPTGLLAAELAVIRRRRTLLTGLRELALAEDTSETAMHQAIAGSYWIFGGQYTAIAERGLMNLHEHDIPLVSGDRSLNIIELKGPEAPLVRRLSRNHLITSSAVHEAVGQCMNYLQTADDLGAALDTVHRKARNLNYDYRRARATVIIGHPARTPSTIATREQVDDAIRIYNAHLSRIQVLTYADLIDTAERALQFEEDSGKAAPRH
jgi:hypothetical protein